MTVSAVVTNDDTVSRTFSGYYPVLVVERWPNASLAATPAMSTPTTGTTAQANSATINTTADNSTVATFVSDWQPVTTGTVAYRSGATGLFAQRTSGANHWATYQTAATAGAQTVGTTAPTGMKWSMLAIEILDSATVPVVVSDSGTRTDAATTAGSFTAADARTGSDAGSVAGSFAAADTVTATDAVTAGQLTQAPDTGTSTQSASTSAALAPTDPRTGSDAATTRSTFTAPDTATHAETAKMGPKVADTGTDSSTVSTFGQLGIVDQRVGADAATVETLFGDLVISLWAVNPTTGALSALPDWTKLTISPERNGPGAISLEYPSTGLNFAILRDTITADRDLEIEVWNLGSNTGSLRGYLQESAGDDVDEDKVTWTFAGGFLELRMGEAVVFPQPLVGELTLGEAVTVPLASVTEAQWDRLLSLGYKGTAGDEAEQLTGVPRRSSTPSRPTPCQYPGARGPEA